MAERAEDRMLSCPSAQPDMKDARVIGVLAGTPENPRIAYLKAGVTMSPSLVAGLSALAPTELLRFAAQCEENRCIHFDGNRCRLAQRIVATLAPVVDALPPCQIRPSCRWHAEEGAAACFRCPQVITRIPKADDALNRAASTPSQESLLGDEHGDSHACEDRRFLR
jgi:hypothetical protein